MALLPPNDAQISLARLLKISIAADTTDIAAARLLDAVASAVGHELPEPSSDKQRAFAVALGREVTGDSRRVASAKIGETLFERNQEAIAQLQLKPGDRVVRMQQFEFEGELRTLEQEFVVSSIQTNGRVFFKGGNGQGGWPTQLRKAP